MSESLKFSLNLGLKGSLPLRAEGVGHRKVIETWHDEDAKRISGETRSKASCFSNEVGIHHSADMNKSLSLTADSLERDSLNSAHRWPNQ